MLASWRSLTKNNRIQIRDPDPDPLVRGIDPIRIHPKMSWIRNTVTNNHGPGYGRPKNLQIRIQLLRPTEVKFSCKNLLLWRQSLTRIRICIEVKCWIRIRIETSADRDTACNCYILIFLLFIGSWTEEQQEWQWGGHCCLKQPIPLKFLNACNHSLNYIFI